MMKVDYTATSTLLQKPRNAFWSVDAKTAVRMALNNAPSQLNQLPFVVNQ